MKVTPKHLAYASILAVGGIALALDSAFPPASAGAAIEPPVAESTAAALVSAADAYSTPVDSGLAPLADRLHQLNQLRAAGGTPPRDAFAIDMAAWGLREAPKPEPASLSASSDANLSLTAIMANDGVGVAVINGVMVRVGDRVKGGYRVESIRPRSVVLDLDGHSITLTVASQH